MPNNHLAYILLLFTLLGGCGAVKKKDLSAFEKDHHHHAGLAVYDPQKDSYLLEYNADRYFVPASNTKVLTLLAGYKLLPDSVPAIFYRLTPDSLIIWGTGDPTLLNTQFPNQSIIEKIKAFDKPVYLSFSHFKDEHFGPGWAWDDYSYTFSNEISALPIYGNTLTVTKTAAHDYLSVTPKRFKHHFWLGDSSNQIRLTRLYGSNDIIYNPSPSGAVIKTLPFKPYNYTVAQLLSDTIKAPVTIARLPLKGPIDTLYSTPSVDVYKIMMQESDNFLAEQLLLTCSGMIGNALDSEIAINHLRETFLTTLSNKPVWRDGSGLSRYNLITPRAMVELWQALYQEVQREELFSLLAQGGVTGTLRNYYTSESTPYIFGKTGTLSNVHNLSGFLITKKGRLLIFSFMNNNYPTSSSPIKKQMEQILHKLYLKY